MYLDALDPVRTSQYLHDVEMCMQYGVQGETTLLKTLLEGKKPTLTQTQIIDSKVIHNIMDNDANERDAFLELIRNKQINVAMYPQFQANNIYGLKNYFFKTLQKGLKENESFHHYSSLYFLQELEDNVRRQFQEKMIDAITNHHYQLKVDGVPAEQVEYMQQYIHNLSLLDFELRGQFVTMGAFQKNFDSLVQKGCHSFLKNELLSEDVHLLCRDILQHNHFVNTRSIYYDFLKNYSNATDEAKTLIKNLVDLSYNESIASTLPNHSCSLSFDSHLDELITHADSKHEPLKKEQILLISRKDESFFTWESLNFFFKEVEALQNKKKISRLEAIEQYQKQFGIHKPIMKTAKYLVLGLVPNIVPFGEAITNPVLEIISNSIESVVGDVVSDTFKNPTLKDVTTYLSEFKTNKAVAQKAYEFTLLTK